MLCVNCKHILFLIPDTLYALLQSKSKNVLIANYKQRTNKLKNIFNSFIE